jgi:hypothetical protein
MAVFTTPFTIPGNYTYDSDKIEVSGGVALVKEDLTNVYGRWHLNESTGGIASDSSGNGRDGTLINMENSDWVAAHLNNGLVFDGINESVDLGDIANFEYNQPFSFECWFLTSGGGAHTFLSRMQTTGPSRGWLLYIQAGLIKFAVRNSATPSKQAWVQTVSTFNDGAFHHLIATYNGSGLASGMKIYVDNVDETLGIVADTLANSTILNSGDCSLGSRNSTNLYFVGTLDEGIIYNRVVTVPEVAYRYNSGTGREEFLRYSDTPSIYKTAGDSGTIASFTNFVVTDGVTEGSKGYQLSEDGITWKYWDGGAWSVAGALDYNIEAVVNANIPTFSAVADKIYIKTFLISDGLQREEIDEIQITYAENVAPSVDAGTNKEVFDNVYLATFSDATFSDPDGTIDFARYKVDGEVDVWTNILQGGYATLLEAAQAFTYQFTNIGIQTVRLQVEDNLGGTVEDSLTVLVKQYTRTVNVRDVVTDEHILNFDFNPGDGSGTAQQDSPFVWSWDYGSFDITVEKDFFYVKQQSIMVTNENELTVYMQASAFLNQCVGTVGLMTEDDKLVTMAWLQQGGELITNPTSCLVKLYDEDDSLKYTDNTVVHDDGHFTFTKSPSGLENEGVYHLEITIVAGGISFVSVIPIGLVERKIISYEGAVHINVANGTTGTGFPKGTPDFPVNNWADAKVIADTNSILQMKVTGDLVIGAGEVISGYGFEGAVEHQASIVLNGSVSEGTTFSNIAVSGEVNGFIHIDHCHMNALTGLRGHYHKCLVRGPFILGGGRESIFSDCYSGIPGQATPIVDMGGAGQELQMRNESGGITLINKTGSENVSLDIPAGQAIFEPSCNGGQASVRGNCQVTDNSGPNFIVVAIAAVTNRSIWAELLADNQIAGSLGEAMADLRAESVGKMVLDPSAKTMTLYEVDNVTIRRVYDLTDTRITMPSFIGRTPR